MSDPIAKAERSKAKDLRQGVVEQQPARGGKKKKRIVKPFRVMYRWRFKNAGQPSVIKRFATRAEAERYIEQQGRSYGGQDALERYFIEEKE